MRRTRDHSPKTGGYALRELRSKPAPDQSGGEPGKAVGGAVVQRVGRDPSLGPKRSKAVPECPCTEGSLFLLNLRRGWKCCLYRVAKYVVGRPGDLAKCVVVLKTRACGKHEPVQAQIAMSEDYLGLR